jgi:anti-sigma factor RsiW
VRCAESLRVQAYFDGELDAIAAAEMERHAEHCVECRALLQDLAQVRTELQRDLAYEAAGPLLRSRIMNALDEECANEQARAGEQVHANDEVHANEQLRPRHHIVARGRRAGTFWWGALSGMGGTALAASLVFFLLIPSLTSPLLDNLVSAHLRSLMPGHLIEVVSTDKHTVKPWFAGRADVSPAVADFASQGYALLGGRTEYLAGQRAAVMVYQHGAHTINVFSWAVDHGGVPRDSTRNGYHLAFFRSGNLEYCAISDTGWDELHGLVRLLRELSARETGN